MAFHHEREKAATVVLEMHLLDTRQGRDLTGTLIADIVLQLLSYVAQFIWQRQAEGIAAGKARGFHFGRHPKNHPEEYDQLRKLWKYGQILAQ